jgi:hypothetical protein
MLLPSPKGEGERNDSWVRFEDVLKNQYPTLFSKEAPSRFSLLTSRLHHLALLQTSPA